MVECNCNSDTDNNNNNKDMKFTDIDLLYNKLGLQLLGNYSIIRFKKKHVIKQITKMIDFLNQKKTQEEKKSVKQVE